MDIQGYIPSSSNGQYRYAGSSSHHHNLSSSPDLIKQESHSISIPTILPTLVEEYSTPAQEPVASSQIEDEEDEEETEVDINSLNPALLFNRYDKRKSSPAILGLPFGLNHGTQLSLHLSQQRNSIEAAMLLANFNKLTAFPKPTEMEHKGQQQWQDDMSIPSQTNKNNGWSDVLASEAEANRRHSYDVGMSWSTMPEAFLERPDLMHNMGSSTSSSSAHSETPSIKHEAYFTPTKVSWSHDDMNHTTYREEYAHPVSPRQHNRLYHPAVSSPLVPHNYHMNYQQHPLMPPQHHHQHELQQQPPVSMLHPLARASELGQKRDLQDQSIHPHQAPPPPPYYPYTFPLPPQQQQYQHQQQAPIQQGYYYPSGKLPLPVSNSVCDGNSHTPILSKPKKRKLKSADDYEEDLGQEANEEDYPDMASRDIEAAKTDPEARPRKQKLRFAGDQYTPQWVRYNGQLKEGLCDTCKPGKWLQLKNSAYWYHKQFYHGISSVSGKEFVQPLETRWMDQDLVEGLCHQCNQWVAVSNVKRKNSVLWYRHAHKCHVYHKPKPNAPKKR